MAESIDTRNTWAGKCIKCKTVFYWPKDGRLKREDFDESPSCPNCQRLLLSGGGSKFAQQAAKRQSVGLDLTVPAHTRLPFFGRHAIQYREGASGGLMCIACLTSLTPEETTQLQQFALLDPCR